MKPRKSRLTKRDLEILMPLFGFHDIKEFSEFVDEQELKAQRREISDRYEHVPVRVVAV